MLSDFVESIVSSYFPPDFAQQSEVAALQALEAMCAQNLVPDIPVVCAVRTGTIYREIMTYSDETGCDLIVMASHRPELSGYLLGHARIVRHARQSVLVVRE